MLPAVHTPFWQTLPVTQRLVGSLHDCPCLGVERQAPAPSHLPSRPHTTPEAVQALCAICPSRTNEQVPADAPVSGDPEQALQPVQALSQQTPSATMPEVHSKPWVAGVPLGFLAVQVPVVPLVILQ